MKKLFYILAATVCFTSCKKYLNASDFKGKFVGKLSVVGTDNLSEINTEVNLSDAQFSVIKDHENFGSGTFKVEDKLTISFIDTHVWTTNFDHNTILNGSYSYQTLGDSLILTKNIINNNQQIRYQYRLRSVKN